MKTFWAGVVIAATVLSLGLTASAVVLVTRPHAGHRGVAHWEAASIVLFVAVGLVLLAALAVVTCAELEAKDD